MCLACWRKVPHNADRKLNTPADCHPERRMKARGLCVPCYQRFKYWNKPERHREINLKSQRRMKLIKPMLIWGMAP